MLTGIAAVAFAMWIAAAGKEDTILYRTRFSESVSGLTIGSAVKFRGVNVGTVEDIKIDQADTRLIQVDMRIRKDTPIKADTVASLKPQGITGVVFVELAGGNLTTPNLAEQAPRGEVPEIPSEESSISTIVNQIPDLLNKTSEIADHIKKLLNDDNINSVSHIISNMETVSEALAKDSQKLSSLLDKGEVVFSDLHDVTRTAKQNTGEFIRNMNESSHQVNEMLIEMRKAIRNVNQITDKVKDNPSSLIFPSKEKGIPVP